MTGFIKLKNYVNIRINMTWHNPSYKSEMIMGAYNNWILDISTQILKNYKSNHHFILSNFIYTTYLLLYKKGLLIEESQWSSLLSFEFSGRQQTWEKVVIFTIQYHRKIGVCGRFYFRGNKRIKAVFMIWIEV